MKYLCVVLLATLFVYGNAADATTAAAAAAAVTTPTPGAVTPAAGAMSQPLNMVQTFGKAVIDTADKFHDKSKQLAETVLHLPSTTEKATAAKEAPNFFSSLGNFWG